MTTSIVHLSDLHFQKGKAENYGVVLNAFFEDLNRQIQQLGSENVYLAFSGDIVQDGDDVEAYSAFEMEFSAKLDKLNIPASRRICVPGNHDISTKTISLKPIDHEGVLSQKLDEQNFNDYIARQPNLLTEKFGPYNNFVASFGELGPRSTSITGIGYEIAGGIGIYCLNTALCSSGGLKDANGNIIKDERRLAIDTRSLYAWIQNCKAPRKILISHHPLNWLTPWAEKELSNVLKNNFSLHISGHVHDQSLFHTFNKGESLVQCFAPPLFTRKGDDLGYAILSISPEVGVKEIAYRQWTKHHSFVSGVNFSNSDDGKVNISGKPRQVDRRIKVAPNFVDRYLSRRLDDALVSFSTQPRIWVLPVVAKRPENVKSGSEPGQMVDLSTLIENPESIMIRALPQFGLTCLAHYLVLEAWRAPTPSAWLYLNTKHIRPHAASIDEAVNTELKLIGCGKEEIKCVVLDSWTNQDNESAKLLQKICDYFPGTPIVCMHTLDDCKFFNEETSSCNRAFNLLYLLGLPRGHIRKVVADYNDARPIGDEDSITAKVVSDLTALNLHRTPLNCLTLLKVSEIDFDESPVNRSEMIKRILFLLFNVDFIPTYKARPDLKDCEYVLGYFCETLIRENNYIFTREHFLNVLQKCCKERFIDLEVQVVFDVLHLNNIFAKRGHLFAFKFTYWIHYFAAQRMHHDPGFAQFIFDDSRYASYPELIEFYTGIDRRREDALQVLTTDIRAACDVVKEKCGFPDGMVNPYQFAQWKSSPAMLEQMQNSISDGVRESTLPTVIKDQYADKHYDYSRPYTQDIGAILKEYSFLNMMGMMKAGARALRNSDYVDPEVKRKLLGEILRCWDEAAKVLIVLMPILAHHGYAAFDGAGFALAGDFGDTPEKRFTSILSSIPLNIVMWCQDDLFSQKMGPLLLDQFIGETDDLKKHELALLLSRQRPRGWKAPVQRYIASVQKNSFYLFDLHNVLRDQYKYSYASPQVLKDIEYLIRMAVTKHVTGTKDPGIKLINKMKSEIVGEVIPERQVERHTGTV